MPLYQVIVPANTTNLILENVTDARKIVSNLRAVNTLVASLNSAVQELQRNILVLKYRFPTIASTGDGRCPAEGLTTPGLGRMRIARELRRKGFETEELENWKSGLEDK